MNVIYTNTIQSITLTAGTADSNYPLSNLQNQHPRIPFRTTGGNSATLTVIESGQSGGLALVITNATDVTITSVLAVQYSWGEDPAGATIVAGEGPDGNAVSWISDSSAEAPIRQSMQNFDGQNGILFATFGSQGFLRTIVITMTAANDAVLSLGQLVVGKNMSFHDFLYEGYQSTSIDKGTIVEMNDGTDYYKPIRILRKPSGNIPMYVGADGIDPDGYNTFKDFWNTLWLSKGKVPLVWHLTDSLLEDNMMASIETEPVAVMLSPNYKLVSLQLKERV